MDGPDPPIWRYGSGPGLPMKGATPSGSPVPPATPVMISKAPQEESFHVGTPDRTRAGPGELMGQPDRVRRSATGTASQDSEDDPRPRPQESEAPEEAASLADVDWEALEPRGTYARYGRRALHLTLLLATLPVALVIALPIALGNLLVFGDPRKILYHQPRIGRHGRVFRIYKFRTMREAKRGAFDSWGSGDDGLRVTRFGRFLRNTHLDELPQFLNILRGEMTFIGPRPEMVEIDAWARRMVPGFHRRLALLPGITGRSQITQGYAGMDPAAYARKLAGDDAYRRRVSLGEDLGILLRTALWMVRGRGWRWADGEGAGAGTGDDPDSDADVAAA